MNVQDVYLVFGIAILVAPFLLALFVYKFIRTRRRYRIAEATLKSADVRLHEIEPEAHALRARLAALEERFAPVIDADRELHTLQTQIVDKIKELNDLRKEYIKKMSTYNRLVREVSIFDDRLSFAEMGVYEPHFDYSDSEEFKSKILGVRDQQKRMVSDKSAVFCNAQWMVGGSEAQGRTMASRQIRLTLRAFNNECEAAIANTRWNNVKAMEKRVESSFQQVNKLNESTQVQIAPDFLALKLRELRLTHEYREKQKAEREERAELTRLAREEARLQRDIERAERDEEHYRRLLAKARAEAETIVGPKLDAFNAQIEMLERDLAQAQARLARAQAMAERTRSGYVYIISNVGSFGEGVVKIGLTRRLDPADRVRELGDASVPFTFDTHAIIYSDDAPGLEHALHGEFEATRINTSNYRKEFFRAALEEVEAAVGRLAPNASFFKDIEAQEYRETLARRNEHLLGLSGPSRPETFVPPDSI